MTKYAITGKAWKANTPAWVKKFRNVWYTFSVGGAGFLNTELATEVSLFGTTWSPYEQLLAHAVLSFVVALFLEFFYEESDNSNITVTEHTTM